jgi:hypothetical protein
MSEENALVPIEAPAFPGSMPLRNDKHERYAFHRALLMPRAHTYRAAGWTAKDDHAANGNACRLERRADVQARIAYLRRQGPEEILQAKRERLEEALWAMHESDIGNLWHTVEMEKRDKNGNVVVDGEGKPIMVKRQELRMLDQMPEDVRRTIESLSVDERGRLVAKTYSRLEANKELRKLLGIGLASGTGEDGELHKLSDAELIAQLALQAKDLGIEIDLSYRLDGE